MKNSIRFGLATFFAVLVFNGTAQAGLLLEPYVGYALTGNIGDGSTSSKLTGSEFGGRVGYSTLGFAVGAEYMARNLKNDASPSTDYTSGDLGLFASFRFPILVRVYATYFPNSELKAKNSSGEGTFKSGNHTKLGLGFTVLPLIDLNIEFHKGEYKKVSMLGVDSDVDPKVKTDNIAFVVSAPFDLF